MPIYEFYCSDCHRIYSFLARSVDTGKRPACPRCGRAHLERKPSAFAVVRGRVEPDPAGAPTGSDDAMDGRLERAMASILPEAEALDDSDPKAGARLLRRLYETAGLPVSDGLQEALRRMESGEDPESVEADLGEALDDDPLLGDRASMGGESEPGAALKGLRRRMLAPVQDPELYEL